MSLSTPTVSLAAILTDAKVISSTAEDSYIVKNLLINQVHNF